MSGRSNPRYKYVVFEQHAEGDYNKPGNIIIADELTAMRPGMDLVRERGRKLREQGHEITLIDGYYPNGYGYIITEAPESPDAKPIQWNLIVVRYQLQS